MLTEKRLKFCFDASGKRPFIEWLNSIKDDTNQARIRTRLDRIMSGNFGDCESIGQGIYELRMFFGPGYRIYFAQTTDFIVLLYGGNKKTQTQDIKRAKALWKYAKEIYQCKSLETTEKP